MNRSVEALLPSWRSASNSYLNKVLSVYKKDACIEKISLHGKEFIVFGRKKDNCDIVLDHSSISRVHAVLFFGEMGSVYVMDLGSSHGTSIGGNKLTANEPAALNPEDELRFGQSSRLYKLESKPDRPQVPAFTSDVDKSSGEVVVEEQDSGKKSKEEEREERQAQIAAFAAEMVSSVPIFTSTTTISATSAGLVKDQTAQLDEEGIQWEIDAGGDEDSHDDEEEEEEESASEGEEEGRAGGAMQRPSADSSSGGGVVKGASPRLQGGEAPGGDIEQLALTKKIPLSHQVDLSGHTKAVTCVSTEPSGNRVVTGSLDYNTKLFDFGGMDRRHLAFKTVEAQEGHPVTAISHSPSGDRYVVCTSSCQPKVFTREGEDVITFCRGDMYLRDLTNTKGHTMEVSGVQWHPEDRNVIMTAGMDGALRLWDLTGEALFGNLINKHVLKIRSRTGQARVGASSCCFTKDGARMIGGATDGSIHIWNTHKHYSRADIVIQNANAFEQDVPVISVRASPVDRGTFASRGEDGTLRVWDIRTPKTPVKTLARSRNVYPTANVEFSPDGATLCCGTSPSREGGTAMLFFFDISPRGPKEKGETPACLGIAVGNDCSAIFVVWQPKTNQIICSTSSGKTRIFFDPRISVKGAVLTAGRNPKRVSDPSDYAAVGDIYAPNALPMYRQENAKDASRKRAEIRKDPIRSKIPEKPGTGAKKQAENTSFFFTKYVTEGKKTVDKDLFKADPREALLKMDELAKKDPIFFGSAYERSQPKRELHHETFEEEQESFKKKQRGNL